LQDQMLELSQDGDTMYDVIIRLPNRNLKADVDDLSIYMPSQHKLRACVAAAEEIYGQHYGGFCQHPRHQ